MCEEGGGLIVTDELRLRVAARLVSGMLVKNQLPEGVMLSKAIRMADNLIKAICEGSEPRAN